MIRLAVTGTDTGVGKTVVGAALLTLLYARGLQIGAMKPVETGVAAGAPGSDAAFLRAAAGLLDPPERVCPIVLPEPLAPWIAARRAGAVIDLNLLDRAFLRLCAERDGVLVEGAGGLLVPLTPDLMFDGLFRRWKLELIVVAGNRLGVINHTLLTVYAARTAGLLVRGIVLNELSPGRSGIAEQTNRSALAELLPELPVIPFPWLADPADPGLRASAAEQSGLLALLPHLAGRTGRG